MTRFQFWRLKPDATGVASERVNKWGKSLNFRKRFLVLYRSDPLCL